jgi:hypothetical protein
MIMISEGVFADVKKLVKTAKNIYIILFIP